MSDPKKPDTDPGEGAKSDAKPEERAESGDDSMDEEWDDNDALLGALSALKTPAPPPPEDFGAAVEEKIRSRSAGKFFGDRTWSDRAYIAILALIILVLGVGLVWLIRGSETGSLKLKQGQDVPELAPGAREAMPKP